MKAPLDWTRDGYDWPHRNTSRFVTAAGLRWHVQIMGEGPAVLLVHGTGAASHSWRGLAPLLSQHFTIVTPDLPGHGFTSMSSTAGASLSGMARALRGLLDVLAIEPCGVVGHSAGAALLARMCLDGLLKPRCLVSLNGALLPLRGLPGQVFLPMARLLVLNPLVPSLFAWRAGDKTALRRLIDSTGSKLDDHGQKLYARLVGNAVHVTGVLKMMANWDLRPLQRDLPHLSVPVTLVVARNDRTLPPDEALRIRALLPSAKLVMLPDVGHLAHEEQPSTVADIVFKCCKK